MHDIMECNVCAEKIKKMIKCIHCGYESCMPCNAKYITTHFGNPKCMNCSKEWTKSFLIDNFTNSFLTTEYKSHRENVLYDRELSMMQETQNEIEERKKIKKINNSIQQLKMKIETIKDEIFSLEESKKIKGKKINHVNVFRGKCTFGDCKGFLNDKWRCGLCETKTCKKCLEIKNEDHKCNEDTVNSILFIENNTKKCPSCSTSISRIDGCNQMWCTMCHTTFDYKSGLVDKGVTHNPHFFEWQLTNKAPVVNICGDFHGLNFDTVNASSHCPCYWDWIYMFTIHCEEYELPRYRVNIDNYSNNLELRISYLNGETSDNEFKRKLQINEKRLMKKHDIFQVLEMFINASKSIIMETFKNIMVKRDFTNKQWIQMDELIKYTNTSFQDIQNQNKLVYPRIYLSFDEKRYNLGSCK